MRVLTPHATHLYSFCRWCWQYQSLDWNWQNWTTQEIHNSVNLNN